MSAESTKLSLPKRTHILRPVHFLHSLTKTAMLSSHTNILDVPKTSNTEELVHSLEGDTFGLRHEEPRNDNHASAEAAEDEIGTVAVGADGFEHDRDCTSDDEVEEPVSKISDLGNPQRAFRDIPLSSSSKRDIQPSEAGSRDLGDVDPAHRTPAELESSCEEVNGNEGDVAGSTDRRTIFGRTEADVETEVEHHDCHHGSGPDEGEFAAEGVDEEDEKEKAGDHLNDAVDARGEEGVGVAGDAEVGEDFGCLLGLALAMMGQV